VKKFVRFIAVCVAATPLTAGIAIPSAAADLPNKPGPDRPGLTDRLGDCADAQPHTDQRSARAVR
jgi:hypothetical protein